MPGHSRSTSNDQSIQYPLEPRRPRRGNPNHWPSTTSADSHSLDLNTSCEPSSSSSSQGASSSAAAMRPFEDNPHHDAESLRPLTPIREKPVQRHSGAAGPVTWMSLPRKDQLAILFLGRLVDFLQVASMQAYVFYQLKSFDASLSDAQISQQAGLLQGCFTGAQVLTAILWGKAADARWCGRKTVLVVGLGGTALSCLGYGFATSFFWAALWRAFGGAINGTVGIIRTMIAEITKEKKYQSRAFLILPMSFNVAGILGPIMGGLLAEPHRTLPGIFGEGAILGFQWIRDYPFALPSLVNFVTLSVATAAIYLFLEETLQERKGRPDYGLELGARLKALLSLNRYPTGYSHIGSNAWEDDTALQMETVEVVDEKQQFSEKMAAIKPKTAGVLPFASLWTRNVVFTLITGAFYDFHLGAFTNIWSLFLSTPRAMGSSPAAGSGEGATSRKRDLPLLFTGGLGMPAATVGVATSFLGILGMILQIFLYPPIQARLGTIRSFRWFLPLFPVAYFVAPYLSILPSSTAPPEPASGLPIWLGIILTLLLQVTARTFTLPASIILLNNCSPHPSVLGTIHGLGQSVSAGFRTVGPVVGGWWYGYGLDIGMVAWGWWLTAIMSIAACITALAMHEGTGHEVFLPGERDED